MNRLAPTQVELEIEIAPDEMAAAEERAFRKLVKSVRLPGFRQGKVPRKVFEQTYGADTITREAMEEVVPAAYASAVREHKLEPVERPKMEFLDEAEAVTGAPTRLKATVEVRPEIVLGQYKGLPAHRATETVTDADVDRTLVSLAKERATVVPVERAARLGDVVTIDYEGKIDGEPFDGGKADGQVTELSEDRFIPGFASGIAGMATGETREVEAHFPEGYSEPSLSGKTAAFTVTLHDVKEYELPAIDDAFAKSLSGKDTLAELRSDVRQRLETIAESRGRRIVGSAMMDALLAAHDIALPSTMVEGEIDQLVNEAASMAARSGATLEDYLTSVNKTEAELRADYRTDAEQRVKGTLLIEQIAKAENITATPSDLANELAALSRQYGQPIEQIQKALGSNVYSLMDGIVRTKTLDFLIDNAALSEAPPQPIIVTT